MMYETITVIMLDKNKVYMDVYFNVIYLFRKKKHDVLINKMVNNKLK